MVPPTCPPSSVPCLCMRASPKGGWVGEGRGARARSPGPISLLNAFVGDSSPSPCGPSQRRQALGRAAPAFHVLGRGPPALAPSPCPPLLTLPPLSPPPPPNPNHACSPKTRMGPRQRGRPGPRALAFPLLALLLLLLISVVQVCFCCLGVAAPERLPDHSSPPSSPPQSMTPSPLTHRPPSTRRPTTTTTPTPSPL